MTPQELRDQLKEADMEKLDQLMKMYDRILLYSLATNLMPPAALQDSIKLWDRVVKKNIDEDATKRTQLLESSIIGRRAKYSKLPDGEDIRLDSLKQWNIARSIILANLKRPDKDNDTEDEFEVDY